MRPASSTPNPNTALSQAPGAETAKESGPQAGTAADTPVKSSSKTRVKAKPKADTGTQAAAPSNSPNPAAAADLPIPLKRIHTQRLREVYRSAGWPYQDVVEVELLAAGLLRRTSSDAGHPLIALTDAGITHLAQATQGNRQARSAHEALVDKVVQAMLRDGRLVWTGLNLRARVPGESDELSRWKMCQPDVFSIRNSSRQEYLEPIVHEIKVSRADLLGDIKRLDKRSAYLDVGGQCWYVLGCDRSGYPIAKANEIPLECGVMVFQNSQLEVLRMAPKRTVSQLPFAVWMALAKATPVRGTELEPCQDALGLTGGG
ncbi:hypothetical protein [Rhodoferax sp. U11-2br]|uniref:hypothetical protein n=1 Tax=Rhodoferax sp. U11-2br TaxID=2838878 RepID=UPI002037478A|nr:hypothetical protein [Rhodoferax sp. U11-2br]